MSMRNKKDRIFVIKSTNYSEADKIVTVYGRVRGKFALLAKGIRKLTSKNRGNIQTFSVADISYYEATGMPLLIETEQVVVADYKELVTLNAQRVLTPLNKILGEEFPNEKIFDALENIVKRGTDEELVNKFRTIFLLQEGLLGELNVCNNCGSKTKLFIDKYSLEPLCENCIQNGNFNRERFLPADSSLYKEKDYTIALDRYIKKIIEETT